MGEGSFSCCIGYLRLLSKRRRVPPGIPKRRKVRIGATIIPDERVSQNDD